MTRKKTTAVLLTLGLTLPFCVSAVPVTGEDFPTEEYTGEMTPPEPQDRVNEEGQPQEVFREEIQWEEYDSQEASTEEASSDETTTESIHRQSDETKTVEDFDILGTEDAQKAFGFDEEELPTQAWLDVPEILQKPALPTGCEAVSLTMALQYEGFDVSMITIAGDFLLYNYEDDNMAKGYVGDPFSEEGAGCFPPALAATAECFFEDQEADYHAYNITGSTMEELYRYVANGTPVILWSTMYMAEPEFTQEDSEYDGHVYQWYRQEHCVVLSGYDYENGTVTVNDPLEGIVLRDMEEFSRIYTRTGQNAVVLRGTTTSDSEEYAP